MDSLLKIIDTIENTYKKEKQNLFLLKATAIILGLTAVAESYYKIYFSKLRFKYSFIEINGIELAVAFIVLTPIILTPVYKFFSDKTLNRYKWQIKDAIFSKVFDEYRIDYKISLNQRLPEIDIINLEFEKKLLTFCYGDDLIFGELNTNIFFRISELHSGSLLNNNFDGLVGVLIFNDESSADNFYSSLNSVDNNNINISLKNNKIYFRQIGEKTHFEFNLKNGIVNREKLIKDFQNLKILVDQMFNVPRASQPITAA